MYDDGCSTTGCSGKSDAIITTKLIGKDKIYSNNSGADQDSYESPQTENLHFEALRSGSGGQKAAVAAADGIGAINNTLGPYSTAENINATPYNVFFWLTYQYSSDSSGYTQLDVDNRSSGELTLNYIEIAGYDQVNTNKFGLPHSQTMYINPGGITGDQLPIPTQSNVSISLYSANKIQMMNTLKISYSTNPPHYGFNVYTPTILYYP